MGLALSTKREFIGKVDQHCIGLSYPIMLHIFKTILRQQIIRFHNFCPNFLLPQKGIFLETWLMLLMPTIGLHYTKVFLKISSAVNTSCVILDQIGSILLHKELFFGKFTNIIFVYALYPIMPQNFKKFLREWIMKHKVG